MVSLSSPTLDLLLREVRILLNQRTEANSFWDNPELITYINDGIRTFFLEINEHAEGQFDKQVDLDIVSGVDLVALPSDFFQIKKLYIKQNTFYKVLAYDNDVTASYETAQGTAAPSYEPYYYFRGNNIVLRPVPGFNATAGLRLEYTALPDTIITGGDSLTSSISPVYKELVVLHAVYKAKCKEDLVNNSNTSQKVAALLSDSYAKFKETVGRRSKYPQSVLMFNP